MRFAKNSCSLRQMLSEKRQRSSPGILRVFGVVDFLPCVVKEGMIGFGVPDDLSGLSRTLHETFEPVDFARSNVMVLFAIEVNRRSVQIAEHGIRWNAPIERC